MKWLTYWVKCHSLTVVFSCCYCYDLLFNVDGITSPAVAAHTISYFSILVTIIMTLAIMLISAQDVPDQD